MIVAGPIFGRFEGLADKSVSSAFLFRSEDFDVRVSCATVLFSSSFAEGSDLGGGR